MVSIPVTHENKLHVNCFAPSFSLHSGHSDTQLWYFGFYSLKSNNSLDVVFKSVQFFNFFLCLISCSNFCVDRKFQASAQTLFDIRFKQISLYFLLLFFFHFFIFVPIYCSAVVKKLWKLQEKESLGFWKKYVCVSQTTACLSVSNWQIVWWY